MSPPSDLIKRSLAFRGWLFPPSLLQLWSWKCKCCSITPACSPVVRNACAQGLPASHLLPMQRRWSPALVFPITSWGASRALRQVLLLSEMSSISSLTIAALPRQAATCGKVPWNCSHCKMPEIPWNWKFHKSFTSLNRLWGCLKDSHCTLAHQNTKVPSTWLKVAVNMPFSPGFKGGVSTSWLRLSTGDLSWPEVGYLASVVPALKFLS